MTHRTLAALTLLVALATAPAFAQTSPVWRTPSDAIAVLSTGSNHDFAYAIVRDGTLRGHNTYCVTVGAHIGKLSVVSIDQNGVVLSNGRVLPNMAATAMPASAVASDENK